MSMTLRNSGQIAIITRNRKPSVKFLTLLEHLNEEVMENYPYVIVVIITGTREEAEKIGKTLVEEKLAASANIIPSIKSFFFWKEKFHDIQEVLLLLNTRKNLFEKIRERAREIHSYELPEVIAIPIIAGSSEFLNWVKENTDGEGIGD